MARYSESYEYSFMKKDEKKRRFSWLNIIMSVVTVLFAIMLLCAYLSQWIDPSKGGVIFAYLPLFLPILYLSNLVLMLFWVVRWHRMVFVPLLVGLIGIGGVSLFYVPKFFRTYDNVKNTGEEFKVMTFNVMGMVTKESGYVESSVDDIVSVVDSLRPDILCFQEFINRSDSSRNFALRVPWLEYSLIWDGLDEESALEDDESNPLSSQAVFSRYPITDHGLIELGDSTTTALAQWCDVAINHDTIRVINVHLQSTSITANEQQSVNEMNIGHDNIRNMYNKLGANYCVRAQQAKKIRKVIDTSPYRVVVCGDFNDTPMSFTYHEIADNLNDAYQEVGSGPSYTYKSFFNQLRIDYVLYSEGLTAKNYLSPLFECSDHKPVVVTFAK